MHSMKKFLSLLIALFLLSSVSFAQNKVANLTEFTQNFKKFEGYFNFYYDEKTGKIYLAIDKLDREFLYFNSLSKLSSSSFNSLTLDLYLTIQGGRAIIAEIV